LPAKIRYGFGCYSPVFELLLYDDETSLIRGDTDKYHGRFKKNVITFQVVDVREEASLPASVDSSLTFNS
jgi:hypothetical protein